MIQPATLKFLRDLKKNNTKEWFDANRKTYETAKEDFEQFVTALKDALIPLEPALAEQSAKDCIFRIFRDVRFSKDKTPYKPHFSASFSKGGRKGVGSVYYLHMEPGAMFAGGGMWHPESPMLKAVRQEIDYNFKEWKGIVESKAFTKVFPKLDGEKLQKPPQGYDVSNPAVEYLKMKSFTAGTPLKDEDLTGKDAVKKVVSAYTTLSPLINFLNRPFDN